MVSTRNHPSNFPPPDAAPSPKASTKSSTRPRSSRPGSWTHTPSAITLTWLIISLPLVMWDMIYVFGRPHTMAGGSLSLPFYKPYILYAQVDKMYGIEAWEEQNGFTAAQTTLNLIETVGYLAYLYIAYAYGEGEGYGRRTLAGGWGGLACLLGFTVAVMTVSKTLLYELNDVFSGFKHTRHNDTLSLIFLYLIPNNLWLFIPSNLIFVFGREILHGLAIASGDDTSKPARAASPSKEE